MRRTRKVLLGLALFGALGAPYSAPQSAAAEEPSAEEPSAGESVAGLAELEQQYEQAEGSYPQKFATVKAAYEAFAAEHAGTEEGLTALLFLLRNTWWEREAGTMNESAGMLVDRVLADHADSPQLAKLIETKFVLSSAQREAVFGRLLGSSPHDVVKAEALLALALADLRGPQASRGRERLASLKERFGATRRRGLVPYGDVAEAHLTPHDKAALAVGKKAPEIEGHDLDGNAMRLSDHLGKVVVLDFWGDW